jgi:pimeloyl-ACP methyl ester carboxylesterase
MKLLHIQILLFILCLIALQTRVVQGQVVKFEQVEPFLPSYESSEKDNIIWGYLHVPENWENSNSDTIKVAVTVIKSSGSESNPEAVVFLQGGPGAAGIQNLGMWRNHPLHKKNDIVLIDLRGTGFSKPRLCPDLGKEIMDILAKNQSESEDEEQKAAAAQSCRQALIEKGIDVESYHSLSISKDLHALKSQLGYAEWNVYAVSYGTYIAQVYASTFPTDIKTLILDSFISDISSYYTLNTSNYIGGLSRMFELCKNDSVCRKNYPNLEEVYFKTIKSLEQNPITVKVDKKVLDSGEFTYNAEDFKIAIQQTLYHKRLVEIVPLLIYEFQNRNEKALANLVPAFSSLLNMDYGVYYSVSCNEVLPNNQFSQFRKDALMYPHLSGGVSFYKSDFKVCDQWNLNRADSSVKHHDISALIDLNFPVLIFGGEYDPITPFSNTENVIQRFQKNYVVKGYSFGHVPSFSRTGFQLTESFVNDPSEDIDLQAFKKESKVQFVGRVTINSGISKVGNSFMELDYVFLLPLVIALVVLISFTILFTIKLSKKKYLTIQDRVIRIFLVLTSLTGLIGFTSLILALLEVLDRNYYILAFGLTDNFNYIFIILQFFFVFLVLVVLCFIFMIKNVNDRSIVFSVLFSNIVVVSYLFYWEIIKWSPDFEQLLAFN